MKILNAKYQNFILFLGIIFMFMACSKDETKPKPTVDFTFTSGNCVAPCKTSFIATVSNAKTFSWSFGDGNTSSLQNPENTYLKGGNYTVTLIVTGDGGTATISKSITIQSPPLPIADFEIKITGELYPNIASITLTNKSQNANTFFWEFGDGTTSNLSTPQSFSYKSGGTFTIKLTATGIGGVASVSKTVTIKPKPTKLVIKRLRITEIIRVNPTFTANIANLYLDILKTDGGGNETLLFRSPVRNNTDISRFPLFIDITPNLEINEIDFERGLRFNIRHLGGTTGFFIASAFYVPASHVLGSPFFFKAPYPTELDNSGTNDNMKSFLEVEWK